MKNSKFAVLMGIGFELTGVVVFSVFIGQELEKHYPSRGLWIAGLICVGFAGWVVHVVKVLKKLQSKD